MSKPITWQNVQGVDSSTALRGMESAGRLFDGAFAQFGKILQDRQELEANNQKADKARRTEDFLTQLYAVNGPERFAQMQASGELGRLVQSTGADRATARTAIDGRLATLQQREREGMAFKNATAAQADIELDRAEQPITYQVKGLLSKGDPASMAQARALTAGLSARGQASMLGLLDGREQELLRRDRDNKEWGWKEQDAQHREKMRPLEIRAKEAGIAASQAGIRASNASTANNEYQLERTKEADAAAQRVAENRQKLANNFYNDGELTPSRVTEAVELMGKIPGFGDGNPEKVGKVVAHINQLASEQYTVKKLDEDGNVELDGKGNPIPMRDSKGNPITLPVPMSVLKAVLPSLQDRATLTWNGGWKKDLDEVLSRELNRVSIRNGSAQSTLAEQRREFLEVMSGLNNDAQAAGSGKRR